MKGKLLFLTSYSRTINVLAIVNEPRIEYRLRSDGCATNQEKVTSGSRRGNGKSYTRASLGIWADSLGQISGTVNAPGDLRQGLKLCGSTRALTRHPGVIICDYGVRFQVQLSLKGVGIEGSRLENVSWLFSLTSGCRCWRTCPDPRRRTSRTSDLCEW
jgi:hypothetical protein